MARLFLKILYFALAAVIGVFMGIIIYQSNAFQQVYDKTQSWLQNDDYTSLCRLYCGYFDSEPLLRDTSKAELRVYAATQEEAYYYYSLKDGAQEGSTKDDDYDKHLHHNYDYAYDIILYIPASKKGNFSLLSREVNGKAVSDLAVRFIDSVNDKTYDYKLDVSKDINAYDYQNRPLSEEDGALHGERTYKSGFYDSWGFFRIHLNQYLIDTIETVNQMEIDSFNIADTSGKSVYEQDFDFEFDFDEKFFQDIKPLHDTYAEYLVIYNKYNFNDNKAGVKKEDYDAATTKFNNGISKWDEDSKAYPTYLTAYKQADIVTSAPIWKTVGIMALYVLAIAIIFIVLFEFKRVKALVFKDRRNHQRYVPNKMPNSKIDQNKPNNDNKPNNNSKK